VSIFSEAFQVANTLAHAHEERLGAMRRAAIGGSYAGVAGMTRP
jgi:hypothetical protein